MKLLSVATALSVVSVSLATSLSDFKIQNPFGQVEEFGSDEKPVPGDSPFIACDLSEDLLLTIDRIDIDPNPPARGANLTFEAVGTFKKQIEEGAYVDLDVRYGYIRLVKQTVDLCEQIGNVDMECPIEAGDRTIKKSIELPKEIPPGKYIVNARVYTVDDEEVTCLSATVEFPYQLF